MILTSLKWLLHVSVFKVLANQAGLILLFIFQGTLYIWAKLIINNKSMFQKMLIMSYHMANCLSELIRSSLFLPCNVASVNLVVLELSHFLTVHLYLLC